MVYLAYNAFQPSDIRSASSSLRPLLKKPPLDKELFQNYRPILNLSFLSKLSARVVHSRRYLAPLTSNNSLLLLPTEASENHSQSCRPICSYFYLHCPRICLLQD